MLDAHYQDDSVTLYLGDCLHVLPQMDAESVDAICTDPPYGLEFMGKEWDSFKAGDGFRRSRNPADADRDSVFGRTSRTSPEYRTGDEAWRTGAGMSKPGIGPRPTEWPSFGGKDNANATCATCGGRMRGARKCACAEPDWRVKGQPLGERAGTAHNLRGYQRWCEQWAAECLRVLKPGGHLVAFGGTRTYHRLACAIEDAGFEIRDSLHWLYRQGFPKSVNLGDGRGTALKPAHEPIALARKPVVGTVAANLLEHGTGALNIDRCRVETTDSLSGGAATKGSASHADGWDLPWKNNPEAVAAHAERVAANVEHAESLGRWPPNILLGPDAAAELDRQSGTSSEKARVLQRNGMRQMDGWGLAAPSTGIVYGDSGGASRSFPVFCYEAKANRDERPRSGEVAHPTVKPVNLIRWLVRLVTPPGGLVLDLFAGTGTTAEACIAEGFRCVLVERDAGYVELIRARLAKPIQPGLFTTPDA